MNDVDSLLKEIFNGRHVDWPEVRSEKFDNQFIQQSFMDGIQPLIFTLVAPKEAWKKWPDQVRLALERETKRWIFLKQQLQTELEDVFFALAEAQIDSLLLKGVPLSLTHYELSIHRPSGDVDILVQEKDVEIVKSILQKLGYQVPVVMGGTEITHQIALTRTNELGVDFTIDLHWKVSNPSGFKDLFNFSELLSRSVRIRGLNANCRALGDQDALLLACVHRVAHHDNDRCLIWLHDIHLLMKGKSWEWQIDFMEFAKSKAVWSICQSGLILAKEFFGTHISEELKAQATQEVTSLYLQEGRRRWQNIWNNLQAAKGKTRVQLFLDYTFPSAEYMFNKYGMRSWWVLPVLYPLRLIQGLPKLMVRVSTNRKSNR